MHVFGLLEESGAPTQTRGGHAWGFNAEHSSALHHHAAPYSVSIIPKTDMTRFLEYYQTDKKDRLRFTLILLVFLLL